MLAMEANGAEAAMADGQWQRCCARETAVAAADGGDGRQ